MNQLIELRRKPHLSISAVKTFLTCPRKYQLQYGGVRPDYYPAALALGSAWHEVVALWLEGDSSEESLDDALRARIQVRLRPQEVPVLFDDSDDTEEQFIERAVRMLAEFRRAVPRPNMVLGTELAFEMRLTHPKTGAELELPVIGAIDAVVIEEEGPALWELKTSKRKWATSQAELDPQLTMYRRAARELGFGELRMRVLVTTKTDSPQVQVVDAERTNAEETELLELVFDVHRAMTAGVSYRQRGWACSSCPYAGACR